MTRSRPKSGVLAFLLCLVFVGIIGLITPRDAEERFINVDMTGRVTLPALTVEFHQPTLSRSVFYDAYGEFHEFSSDYALVSIETVITAHGDDARHRVELRTKDGYSYAEITLPDASVDPMPSPGLSLTSTHVFELPIDKVPGGVIVVYHNQSSGLQAVDSVGRYRLPTLELTSAQVTIPAGQLGPPS